MISIVVLDEAVFNRRAGILAEYAPTIFVSIIVLNGTIADQGIRIYIAVDPTAVTSRSRVAGQIVLDRAVANDGT